MFEALTTYFTARNQKAPEKAADVDVGAESRRAAEANLNNMPYIQALLARGNRFNQEQNLQMLNQAVPGYNDWAAQQTANAEAYGQGRLSKEQSANLTRLAAERGINTGTRGQMGQYSLLRDFGIDQYKSGQESRNIMAAIAGMAKVNPMSPLSFMVTPEQAIGVAESNRSAYQSWLNAEQASKNVRKNAFWAGLAAGDATFQQASGYGSGSGNSMGGAGGWGSMMKMFGKGGSGGPQENADAGWGGDNLGDSGASMDFTSYAGSAG